jgi:hypothetical protein
MDLNDAKIMTFGYITSKPNLTVQEKIQLLDFVKEASGIQVLNLLATGRMKTDKEILKEGEDYTVDRVKEKLEIQFESILREAGQTPFQKDTKAAGDWVSSKAGKAGEYVAGKAKETGDYWGPKVKDVAKTTSDYWGPKVKPYVDTAKDQAKEVGDYWGPKVKDVAKTTKDYWEPEVQRAKDAYDKSVKSGSNLPGAEGRRKELADDTLKQAKERQSLQRPKPGEEGEGSQPASKGNEPKGVEALKGKAREVGGDIQRGAEKGYEKGSELAGQGVQWAQQNPGQAAAAGALGIAAITAGVLAYKRFFSKAARACGGLTSSQKTACMKKYKVDAKKAEVGVLTSKLSSCKGNPKCVNKIRARIASAKQEMQS